jgi:hypothetical protein
MAEGINPSPGLSLIGDEETGQRTVEALWWAADGSGG